MDQIAYGTFIKKMGPGRIKMRRVAEASSAEVIVAYPNKWNPAERTEW